MKTIYIECKMGAAGDMLMAALYELLDEPQKAAYIEQLNGLFAPDIRVEAESKTAAGICGTHMRVKIRGMEEGESVHGSGHTHSHCSYASIAAQIHALALPDEVRGHAAAVYRMIGEAEAKVHGTDIEQIHFHEVGTLDAVADVVGCCLLFSMLNVERVVVSPIHVGNGMVHCAHGILPVPAPATAELLRGVPFYTGGVDTELCTPTGAALLKHFASEFGTMPTLTITRTGVGLGTKELTMLNAVRTFLGDDGSGSLDAKDRILDISCNLDDMTGEALGYAAEKLLASGALDVFCIPVQMKKNRPGILLHCFCEPAQEELFTGLILKHTTTRGVRMQYFARKKLTSRFETETGEFGPVTRKISEGYGISKAKYEYEDLKRIAEENDISLPELGARLAAKQQNTD